MVRASFPCLYLDSRCELCDPGAISDVSGYFPQLHGNETLHLHSLDCLGTEHSFLECPGVLTEQANCSSSFAVGVICQG